MKDFRQTLSAWYDELSYKKQVRFVVACSVSVFSLVWMASGNESFSVMLDEKAKTAHLLKDEENLSRTKIESPNETLIRKRGELTKAYEELKSRMPSENAFDFAKISGILPKGGEMEVLPPRILQDGLSQKFLKISFTGTWDETTKMVNALTTKGSDMESIILIGQKNGEIKAEIIVSSLGKEDSWQKMQ